MSLETNKLVAAFLVAGLTTIGLGKVSDALYHDGKQPETRGYSIAVSEAVAEEAPAAADAAPAYDINALVAAADAKTGEGLVKACKACHDFSSDNKNKVGPGLWSITEHNIAHHEGFNYSADLKAKAAEKWTVANLDAFLTKPKTFAKGTKMAYAGMKKPEDRAAVIKYLQSLK